MNSHADLVSGQDWMVGISMKALLLFKTEQHFELNYPPFWLKNPPDLHVDMSRGIEAKIIRLFDI